jgi:predicted ATPase
VPHTLSEISPPPVGPTAVDRRARIIELNDQLRSSFKGGRVQMTRSVYDLDAQLRGRALAVSTRYNKFDADSDYDAEVFIFAGYSFEWHIEYRNSDGEGVSADPSDPTKNVQGIDPV